MPKIDVADGLYVAREANVEHCYFPWSSMILIIARRLEAAHASAEAALVEAERRIRVELRAGAGGVKVKFSEPPNCKAHLLFVNSENFVWGAAII
jgi:hypothetical protein